MIALPGESDVEAGPIRLLLVEDNVADAQGIVDTLREAGGFQIQHADTIARALVRIPETAAQVVLLDLTLPDAVGVAAVISVCAAYPELPVVVLTGIADETVGLRSVLEGAQDYLIKGRVDGQVLVRSLRHAIERKRAQERLRFQAQILESAGDGLVAVDLEGRIVFWNLAAERLQGSRSSEVLGRDFRDVLLRPESRDKADAVFARLASGGLWHGEFALLRRDGGRLPVLVTVSHVLDGRGATRAFIGDFVDISERRRQEDALRNAQKMESLGVMAGGIAHDFNNLLGAILGFGSLALRKQAEGAPARLDLERLLQAAQRAADLTRQILAYSGRGHFEVRRLDLNALIRENLHLFEVAVPRNVVLVPQLASGLPSIRADAGQLQQVVMNLLLNGAEAIGEGGGAVTVLTGTRDVGPDDELLWSRTAREPLAPGRYVTLEVHDDGVGMDADTMARIFDPFFTTKDTGRGLGLAAVIGIVRGHGGGLRVYSERGRGTTFKLLFPAAAASLPSAAVPVPPAPPVTGGLVLVVDDDERMRAAVQDMLEDEGFEVLTARDGAEGLSVYAGRKDDVGLIVLDLSMPGLSGLETFQRLRTLSTAVPVLLTSGYHEVEATREFAGLGLTGFIQKPYQIDTLLAEVHRCLRRET